MLAKPAHSLFKVCLTDMASKREKPPGPAWYCLRTQHKREHITARNLRSQLDIETFCPRISQMRKTKVGKKRFVEALFPNYLFARFDLREQMRSVSFAAGVNYIVHNGREDPYIPDQVMEELQATTPDGIISLPDPAFATGSRVEVLAGSLKGLNGTVLAVLSPEDRVAILLNFLGRDIEVSLHPSMVHSL
jgi:transcriptional antiterminator RfaH